LCKLPMSTLPALKLNRAVLASLLMGALFIQSFNLPGGQVPNPAVTASATPFSASFVAANLFDAGNATEYASKTQGAVTVPFTTDPNNGTWVQFDFGSTVTFDTFINSGRNNTVDVVGANRLIVSSDPTFDNTDTIVDLPPPGVSSVGIVRRFNPVSGRYVRWEVVTRTGTGLNLGARQMWFLNTAAGQTALPNPAVIGSSTPFPGFSASSAANGDAGYATASEYASQGIGANMFVTFDFGASIQISGFDFWNRVVDHVTTYNMIFANDPSFSSPVATQSYTASADGNVVNSGTFAPVIARYVRLQATGAAGGNNTGIREIQFYTPANQPPFIITQPVGGTRLLGDSFSFSLGAGGGTPLRYQWFNGVDSLPTGTNASLVLTNLQVSSSGDYSVIVSNTFGSVTSAPVTLNVINPAVDTASDLRAYYTLDDGLLPRATDSSGNGLDGNFQGIYDDDTEWVNGRIQGALQFRTSGSLGTNEVMIVSDPNSLLDFSTNSEFTLSAWVKAPPVQEDGGAIFARGTGGGGEQYALDIVGGAFRFFVRNGAATAQVLQGPVRANNTWQHVVAVYSRNLNRMKLYVNTAEVGSSTPFSGGLLPNQHDVSIGARQNTGTTDYNLNFAGTLDDLRIYARALTPSDVSALYYEAPPQGATIAQQPRPAFAAVGSPAAFSVAVDGTVPILYQWFQGSTPILNATNDTLTITNAQLSAEGDYSVRTTNSQGFAVSDSAHLTVIPFLDLRTAAVQADSIFNSTFPPQNAFDGLRFSTGPNTVRWASLANGPPHWIWVDLGQDMQLRNVWVDWEFAAAADSTLRVRSSAEGPSTNPADWHTVASYTGYAQNGNGIDGPDVMYDFTHGTIQFPGSILPGTSGTVSAGVVGRYLMLHATAISGGFQHASIWEMQVDAIPNQLPIAPVVTLNTTTNHGVSITVADLLSKCSDADGDTITLVSVASSSANGIAVGFDSTTISYTPATDFTGADSISYVITDGKGAFVTGRIEVLVYPGAVAALHFFPLVFENGGVSFSLEAIAGRAYRLERATLITGPWETIDTVTAGANGSLHFSDGLPPDPVGFYRVAYP
jgi:hypothetical protein